MAEDKIHKRVKERAHVIKEHLLHSVANTAKFLKQEFEAISKSCRKNKQKSRPTSLELIHKPEEMTNLGLLEAA